MLQAASAFIGPFLTEVKISISSSFETEKPVYPEEIDKQVKCVKYLFTSNSMAVTGRVTIKTLD